MSAQFPKQPMQSKQPMQPKQSDQTPASQTEADRVPAKRKATEQPQDDRPPTRPGTLPFMWNLPTTPSLPNLNAGSTPVASDDEYEHQLELENDKLREELEETKEQLREAEEKIKAKYEDRLETFKEIEWAVDEHHKLVHQALDEIDSGRAGPRGRHYKPGQLPLYILDKSQMDLFDSVSGLKELFYEKQEEE